MADDPAASDDAMRTILLRAAFPLAVITGVAFGLLLLPPILSWTPDEFGRNSGAILSLAILYSVAKGLTITLAIGLLASLLAYLVARGAHDWARIGLRAACAIVESVPLVLWVLIIVVSVKGPRVWVTLVAFGVLALPTVTQILLGEFTRLRATPFVEAAYLLGLHETRVYATYLLPAAFPVLIPVFIQVLGSAIAIDGAIGVLGLGSRSDMDLGVFLLRGKEQFVTRPGLLASALIAYGGIYLYLQWVARWVNSFTTKTREAQS